ncbi:hypothetical protein ABK040_005054 [Willaertia magna]
MSTNNNSLQDNVFKFYNMMTTCSSALDELISKPTVKSSLKLTQQETDLLFHGCGVYHLQETQQQEQNKKNCISSLPLFKTQEELLKEENATSTLSFNENYLIKNKPQVLNHLQKCFNEDVETNNLLMNTIDTLQELEKPNSLKNVFPNIIENIKQEKEISLNDFHNQSNVNQTLNQLNNKYFKKELNEFKNCIKEKQISSNTTNPLILVENCKTQLDKYIFSALPVFCKTSFLNCLKLKQKSLENASIIDEIECNGNTIDRYDSVCKHAFFEYLGVFLEGKDF